MKVLRFKNECETAEMVVRLEMANAEFTIVGRTELMVDDNEPALVLPPTFVVWLRGEIADEGYQLIGVSKCGSVYRFFVSGKTLTAFDMQGAFSISDVMKKVRILCA